MTRLAMLGLWLLCQLCHMIASVQMLVGIITGSRRTWTLAVSYDQLGNVVLGGHEDWTISARAWANRGNPRWALLVRLLDLIEPGHCDEAWRKEMERLNPGLCLAAGFIYGQGPKDKEK